MAKYCPKCFVCVNPEDTICDNCGNVLKAKAVAGEVSPDEIIASEIVADEIISDGGFAEETVADELVPELILDEEIVAHENGIDETLSEEIVADEIVAHEIISEKDTDSSIMTSNKPPVTEKSHTKDKDIAEVQSLGDWMLTLLLLYIPVVNIIMLIIWSVDAKTNPNKKHFAWAQLIYMGIWIVLSIIFSTIALAAIMTMISTMGSF